MYYILYSDRQGTPMWECVDGEDAMQIRLDELCKEHDLNPEEDVMVFDADDELDAKAEIAGGEKEADWNTEISYRYIDAGNYRVNSCVVVKGVFSDDDLKEIKTVLNDGEFFIPAQVGLPENRFDNITVDDHIWFVLRPDEDIRTTLAVPDVDVTAEQIAKAFHDVRKNGWDEIGAMRRLGLL